MRIAYLTSDEVNLDLARQWALDFDCEVIPLSTVEPLPSDDVDGAIYDLDFLAQPFLKQVLAGLLNSPRQRPTVVHAYNLRQCIVNELLARGVYVRRRLERGILATLRREVQYIQTGKGEARTRKETPSVTSNAILITYSCVGGEFSTS
jgi:hypothetical protein